MSRLCLDCGTPVKGRSDKKFCDDFCRTNYNNKAKSEDNSFVNQINAILRKNRRIIQKLNPEGKVKVQKEALLKEGFNFGYYTHIYETLKGNTYHFCYEYGYLKLDKEEFLLVKKEDS